ncbi:MAG: hypothetical protein KatS3mg090_0380 [Patescibacteria group bacterium]|nr:MAG: hypothetical protein KatS3mg090_0380 [Patescibacteria group bacterium]
MSLKNQQKIKSLFIFLSILSLLFVTRFYNLSWGLPFPFHPDERNMADALLKLSCANLSECFAPDFYAYGQTTIYLGYMIKTLLSYWLVVSDWVLAFLSLRLISALSSIAVVFLVVKIFRLVISKDNFSVDFYLFLMLIFSPVLIQFSHFGTTEAVLSFLFVLLIYTACLFLDDKIGIKKYVFVSSLVFGIASAIKLSSVLFAFVVVLSLFIFSLQRKNELNFVLQNLFYFGALSIVFYFLASPYNLFKFNLFLSSMHYESSVALGSLKVFYTQQFDGSVPVLFQFLLIFPYALGIASPIFFVKGYLSILSERNLKIILIKLSVLFVFLVNSFIYAKWTRFLAPIYPLVILIVYLELIKLKNRLLFFSIVFLFISQGILFFSLYLKPDIRLLATNWLVDNIPAGAVVAQESGNVVDLPLVSYRNPNIKRLSLNLYEADFNPEVAQEVLSYLEEADYVILPSRRVFANFSCFYPEWHSNLFYRLVYFIYRIAVFNKTCSDLKSSFPVITKYYQELANPEKFQLYAEFAPFRFSVSNKRIFYDELAEETFSVFDHPIIRVYKRVSK